MPSLEQILEISTIAIIFFFAGFFLQKALSKKEKDKYKDTYKQIIENFLSLNVTHLHDSANLFNLIKNNSKEQNIVNFATGSAFHFRSIFNSLKKSILQVRDYDPDELNNSTLYKLIEKEDVNLKDLINIELFQLGNFSQIQVSDNTSSQYALTHGNFELLSKVFLNLVENALKYSNEKIKISLNDENNLFTIRIMSFGKSISEDISIRINNKIYDDVKGHGLSSLIDIMNYHDANIHITNLPNEGSSINLEFKKTTTLVKKALYLKENQQKLNLPKAPLILATSLFIVLGSYIFLKASKTSSNDKLRIIESDSQHLKHELTEKIVSKNPKKLDHKQQSSKLSDLNDLIDQETAKLGLDMNL